MGLPSGGSLGETPRKNTLRVGGWVGGWVKNTDFIILGGRANPFRLILRYDLFPLPGRRIS